MNSPSTVEIDEVRVRGEFTWTPFTVGDEQPCFQRLVRLRLNRGDCSHWGPAVYRWEGLVGSGEHEGRTGLYIGETKDLRARINQYRKGTQKKGNARVREEFPERGDIRLWVIEAATLSLSGPGLCVTYVQHDFSDSYVRKLVESLLLCAQRANEDSGYWVVNAAG